MLVCTLVACGTEAPPPPERIRAIKTILVTERASGQNRQFPGVVEPVDTSSVSFEVSGQVMEVRVDAGEKVEAGQVLAVLDRKQFELDVTAAEASLARAQAEVEEKKSAYQRERRIYAQDSGATSQSRIEQLRAAYQGKVESVNYSRAQLELSRRNLENTSLPAPFDGAISARNVEAFEEVHRGQPISA